MAMFVLKLRGLTGGPWGLQAQMSDAAANRILNAARQAFGKVPDGTGGAINPGLRDMTDQEVAMRMFEQFINGWLVASRKDAQDVAAKTARDGVVQDVSTNTVDNT